MKKNARFLIGCNMSPKDRFVLAESSGISQKFMKSSYQIETHIRTITLQIFIKKIGTGTVYYGDTKVIKSKMLDHGM